MTRRAVEALGGMKLFISKGDRVVLKPNASFDSGPETGANTHPEIVSVVATLAREAGAADVIVIDNTLDEPRRCFARSGIDAAAKKAGARAVFQELRNFKDTEIGGVIGRWPVMAPVLEADKFINLPIVKQHGLSRLTAGMKNLYGVIGGRRSTLHRKIDESIVSLASFLRPTLIILDGYSAMVKNGPSGGSRDDLIHPRTICAGSDQVAVDSFAASLLCLEAGRIGYLALAAGRGLGVSDYKSLRPETIRLS